MVDIAELGRASESPRSRCGGIVFFCVVNRCCICGNTPNPPPQAYLATLKAVLRADASRELVKRKCRTGDNLLHLVALFNLHWLLDPLVDAGANLCMQCYVCVWELTPHKDPSDPKAPSDFEGFLPIMHSSDKGG
jgi:hypothetical protein